MDLPSKIGELDMSADIAKYDKLVNQVDSMETEQAYWRKYHDLNYYILDELTTPVDDGNCEDIPLTHEDILAIQQFIRSDGEDSTQVDDILADWDESATYVYHPWW